MSHLIQGSDEWLAFRREHVTASEIPILMGISPYQTAYSLYMQKMQLEPETQQHAGMTKGLELESEALDKLHEATGIMFLPKVVVCSEVPYLMASLDGMSLDGKHIVEVKHNNINTHRDVEIFWSIPMHHIVQMNAQMYCTGLKECFYVSYNPNYTERPFVHLKVQIDQQLISQIKQKSDEFWQCLQNFTPPEICEEDYVDLSSNDEWHDFARAYLHAKEQVKNWESKQECFKNELQKICGERNSKGSGITLTKCAPRRTIDYKAIVDDIDPSLIPKKDYTRIGKVSYRITEEKL